MLSESVIDRIREEFTCLGSSAEYDREFARAIEAEVKAEKCEPVAEVTGKCYAGIYDTLPIGTLLYATPQPCPCCAEQVDLVMKLQAEIEAIAVERVELMARAERSEINAQRGYDAMAHERVALQAKVAELECLLKTSFKYAQHHNDMRSEWNTHGWQSESLITELREIAHAIGETYRGN